ncbi:MAG: aminopeptidase [Saprospiraceae bacterium]|nr:aminopeptidase [Saprospiraceae bacterium]
MITDYAKLLVDYCLEMKKGEQLLVQSSTLAIPLVKEVYRLALRRGAMVVTELEWSDKINIFYEEAEGDQLSWESPLLATTFKHFDAYLHIRAPYNIRGGQEIDTQKRKTRAKAMQGLQEVYNSRTADRSLRRCLCQYPTHAAAQEAGMSLPTYERFVYNACHLFDENPQDSWLTVRAEQQRLIDFLNGVKQMRFVGKQTDLSFSVADRTWINSDGRTNMPSGEVFTAPVEDSVEGKIYFSYPSVYRGHPVQDIHLTIEEGEVKSWSAEQGAALLDDIFDIEGARRFGEVAIGTNYHIRRATKNILFDEKIGGTIHMAIGQTYRQTGGTNRSTIHWDMIKDMEQEGQIWADEKLIYECGKFLI